MNIIDQLDDLKEQHRLLDEEIRDEWEHYISDAIIRDKKVQRLILKEKIALLEKELQDH